MAPLGPVLDTDEEFGLYCGAGVSPARTSHY